MLRSISLEISIKEGRRLERVYRDTSTTSKPFFQKVALVAEVKGNRDAVFWSQNKKSEN